LILEGPQGSFKSTAFRTIGGTWFTDDLADLANKDAAMQCSGAWVIEMSELASMSRAESGKVKAFMSRASDRYRPPYGKRIVDQPRQCVFCGTVNQESYLADETGGRRFWPVKVGKINLNALAADRDQLLAESVRLYREGAKWWIANQAIAKQAEEEQASRYVADPWTERVLDFANHEEAVTVPQILCHLIPPRENRDGTCSLREWDQSSANRVARILRANGFERFQVRSAGSRAWSYRKKDG
jgi:predicted P-loop ATPase